jgi:uncharacterized OB-fold protein
MTSWTLEVPGTLAGSSLEDLRLSGTRCDRCGRTFFPARRNCPRCLDDRHTRPVALAGEGILHSFSLANVAPPGFTVPHAQGYIDLAENGPRIFSVLADYGDGSCLSVGCPMVLKIVELGKDKDDRVIVGYRFRPA